MIIFFVALLSLNFGMKSHCYKFLPQIRLSHTLRSVSVDYQFIDCGNYQRLEKFGDIIVRRSCPSASFPPKSSSDVWNTVHLAYEGVSGQQGQWKHIHPVSLKDWSVCFHDSLKFNLSPMAMGQVGVFPEQQHQWRWIQKKLSERVNKMMIEDVNRDPTGYSSRNLHVLNAFAYTGGSSLAALSVPGVKVTHLDASKTSNGIARDNRDLSGYAEKPIRFISEDCMTFLAKELRRFNSGSEDSATPASISSGSSWDDSDGYDGLIFDPPAYGRSGTGKQWKLITDMPKLFEKIPRLLSASPVFVLMTCHDPAWTPDSLAAALEECMRGFPGGRIDKGELKLSPAEEFKGRGLSLGCYARWSTR